MSDITERLMRGDYISKAECMLHDDEIGRAMDAYPKAMAAMEAHQKLMRDCICDFDGDLVDGRMVGYRAARAECPVHAQEDADGCGLATEQAAIADLKEAMNVTR